jgi:EAL domain-containing protein (putative c-di-GMP-specific phosphodiesterase class I)/GGDEF domain-containing protein
VSGNADRHFFPSSGAIEIEMAQKADPGQTEEPSMTSGRTSAKPNAVAPTRTLAFAAAAVPLLVLADLPFLSTGAAGAWPAWAVMATGGTLLTMAGLWVGLRRMGRRIDQLGEAVDAVAEGRHDVEIPRLRFSLLRPLADRLSVMAERLAQAAAEDRRKLEIKSATGLPRRGAFKARVGAVIAMADSQGGLIHIDIVNLRELCERYGESFADLVLGMIARRMAAATPVGTIETNADRLHETKADCLAMLGHAEHARLLLHLPGFSSIDALERQATQILAAFAEPLKIGDRRIPIELAIGIARYPEDGDSFEDVANKTALAAKRAASPSSPDCMIVYDSRTTLDISTNDGLEHELRQAIAERQIEVCYQPKVHACDWSNAGVEALVRWRHPTRGLISPCDFIPVAEASGLIVELGMVVIATATAQCAEWSRHGRLIGISVNVAAGQVARPDFADRVLELVELNDCPPTLLTIEITETMAHTRNERFIEQLERLRAAGLKLAIDDFGVGYSNLAHLAELPFDALKIDRSLISGLETSSRTIEVCRAIVSLGKALGCRIVAEGVETAGQAAAACALGCDEIQGYYISSALAADEFVAWHEQLEACSLSRAVQDIFGADFAPEHAGGEDVFHPEPPELGMLKLFSHCAGEKPAPKKLASG